MSRSAETLDKTPQNKVKDVVGVHQSNRRNGEDGKPATQERFPSKAVGEAPYKKERADAGDIERRLHQTHLR